MIQKIFCRDIFYFFLLFTSVSLSQPTSSSQHSHCDDPDFVQEVPNIIVACQKCAEGSNLLYSYTFNPKGEHLILDHSDLKLYEEVTTTCNEPKWIFSRFEAVDKDCYVTVTYNPDNRENWIKTMSGTCIAHKGRYYTPDNCEIRLINKLKWTVDGKASTLPLKFSCKKDDPNSVLKKVYIIEESTCEFPKRKYKNSYWERCDHLKSLRRCSLYCFEGCSFTLFTEYNEPFRMSHAEVKCNKHDEPQFRFGDCLPNKCEMKIENGSYEDIEDFTGNTCKHLEGNHIEGRCFIKLKNGLVLESGYQTYKVSCGATGEPTPVIKIVRPKCVYELKNLPSPDPFVKTMNVNDGCLLSYFETHLSVVGDCEVTMKDGLGFSLDGITTISTNPLTCPENIPPDTNIRARIIVLNDASDTDGINASDVKESKLGYWFYIVIGVLFLAVIVAAFVYYKRRKNGQFNNNQVDTEEDLSVKFLNQKDNLSFQMSPEQNEDCVDRITKSDRQISAIQRNSKLNKMKIEQIEKIFY